MIKLTKCSGNLLINFTALAIMFSISVPDRASAQNNMPNSSSKDYLSDSPILHLEYLSEENIVILFLANGEIYNFGRLVGLDLNTGLARWEVNKIDWEKATAFKCDTLLILSEGEYAAGYNLNNGEKLWEITTPIYHASCESRLGFFYESYHPKIFGVDLLTGEIVLSAKVKRLKGSIPFQVLDDHYVAVFQKKGFRIYDINTSTYWEYKSENKSNREFNLPGYTQKTFKSSSSLCNTDETISFSNITRYRDKWYYAGKSRIVSFDSNGREIWSFKLPNNLKGQVLLHAKDSRLFFINTIAKKYLLNDENAFALGALDIESGTQKGILFYSESEFLTDLEFKNDSLYIITSQEFFLVDIADHLRLDKRSKGIMGQLLGKPVAISKGGYEKTERGFQPITVDPIYIESELGDRIQLADSSSYAIVNAHEIFSIKSCTDSVILLSNAQESWIIDQNNRLVKEKSFSSKAYISGCYIFDFVGNRLTYQNICR